MKKINILALITLFIATAFTDGVYAAGFKVNISGSDSFDSETSLSVTVSGYDGVDMTYGGISALEMHLDYDSSKISVTPVANNNFGLTQNASLVILDRAEGVASGTSVMTLKINNKSLSNNETTTISIKNITGSDSENDFSAPNVSKTIKYYKKETSQPQKPANNKTVQQPVDNQPDATQSEIEDDNGEQSPVEELEVNEEDGEKEDNENDEDQDHDHTTIKCIFSFLAGIVSSGIVLVIYRVVIKKNNIAKKA